MTFLPIGIFIHMKLWFYSFDFVLPKCFGSQKLAFFESSEEFFNVINETAIRKKNNLNLKLISQLMYLHCSFLYKQITVDRLVL